VALVDLSIVIVTRNTCALLCAALRSVFESRDALTKRIIVVDNGSTDDTALVVQREFPTVKLVCAPRNLGFSRANNLGAKEAEGEWLLLLNSDARLKPDALVVAVDWMRQHADCGVCGGQLLDPDGTPQNSIANAPSLATELLNKSLLRRIFPRRFPGKENRRREPIEVESIIGAFMLIRREVWDALGGLDERYFFFLEETDFCVRARQNGWKVYHLPQVEIWHEQGRSAAQTPLAARIEYWRSRYLYFQKHHGRVARGVLQAGLGLRLLVDWLVNGLLTVLTLGRSVRCRERWLICAALWRWHLSGRPDTMGLPR
jgi:GT2 family glycosyltransferase